MTVPKELARLHVPELSNETVRACRRGAWGRPTDEGGVATALPEGSSSSMRAMDMMEESFSSCRESGGLLGEQ